MSCLRPIQIDVKNKYPTAAYPESYFKIRVGCGKCVNCLKIRQMDYTSRILNEALKGAEMYFITLTYRNSALPISERYEYVFKDTGELCTYVPHICDNEHLEEVRSDICSKHSGRLARYSRKLIYEDEDVLTRLVYTPSLNREDVKSWLKTARIQYKRIYGKSLDFKYGICGEYGPRGCRPHYHMITLGLTLEQVNFLTSCWYSRFGRYYVQQVPMLNDDGTNARLLVSRYIGKYISKGKFDADSVLDGYAQKGRLCNSKRLGTVFTDEHKSYFKCFDLFGKYNPYTLKKVNSLGLDSEPLSISEVDSLVKEIIKRNVFTFQYSADGSEMRSTHMPQALKRAIWYERVPKLERDKYEFFKDSGIYRNYKYKSNGKNIEDDYFSESKIASPLILRKVADFLQSKFDADNLRKFKEFCSRWCLSETDTASFVAFSQCQKDNDQTFYESREEFKIQAEYFISKDGQ